MAGETENKAQGAVKESLTVEDRASIQRGLDDAKAGRTEYLGSFAQGEAREAERLLGLLWDARDAIQRAVEREDGLDGAEAEPIIKRLTRWIAVADKLESAPSASPEGAGLSGFDAWWKTVEREIELSQTASLHSMARMGWMACIALAPEAPQPTGEGNTRIDRLESALKYARRFLKPEDHDTDYVDAILREPTGEGSGDLEGAIAGLKAVRYTNKLQFPLWVVHALEGGISALTSLRGRDEARYWKLPEDYEKMPPGMYFATYFTEGFEGEEWDFLDKASDMLNPAEWVPGYAHAWRAYGPIPEPRGRDGLIWTKEKPTKEGWYWFHQTGVKSSGISDVFPFIGNRMCMHDGDGSVIDLVDGQWAGPLPEPKGRDEGREG